MIAMKLQKIATLLSVVCLFAQGRSVKAATYEVGAGKPYAMLHNLPPLQPGDVVRVFPGTYHECIRWKASGTREKPITIRSAEKTPAVLDGTGLNVRGDGSVPRALFQIEGDHYVIEHLEFRNARNDSWNGAGIRITGAHDTVIRACKITSSDMGVMSDGNDECLIEHCEIAYNGNPEHFDGYAHNLYLGGSRTTLQYCYIHNAVAGINFKTRGHFTLLKYNYIADSNDGEISIVDSAETARPLSNAILIGNIIVSKSDRTGNEWKFIDFGQDVGGKRDGCLFLVNNTLIAGEGRIEFLSASASTARVVAANNIFYGSSHITRNDGARVVGTNNWVGQGASIPTGFTNTLQGAAPGFVDEIQRNYHLRMSSICWESGMSRPTGEDGEGKSVSTIARFEYQPPLGRVPRIDFAKPSLGAFGSRIGSGLPKARRSQAMRKIAPINSVRVAKERSGAKQRRSWI